MTELPSGEMKIGMDIYVCVIDTYVLGLDCLYPLCIFCTVYPVQGSAQEFLSSRLTWTQVNIDCMYCIDRLCTESVFLYIRIALVGNCKYWSVLKSAGHFVPLLTSVGRTLPVFNHTIEPKI